MGLICGLMTIIVPAIMTDNNTLIMEVNPADAEFT
jgi:hypothetical protein